MERLIVSDKSVIPAADVSVAKYSDLLKSTTGVSRIEAIKTGFSLGYRLSLTKTVALAHEVGLKVIHDHQKAGTDIPDTGKEYAAVCREANVDAAIVFPQSGPVTGEAWIKALQDAGVYVIVGGEMTHKKYKRSEGGYIADEALTEMYQLGAENNVRSFVVPGNRVERVSVYKKMLDDILGEGQYDFMSPGFIAQGGEIASFAHQAGNRWHAITGRAITEAENMRTAAEKMTSQIK